MSGTRHVDPGLEGDRIVDGLLWDHDIEHRKTATCNKQIRDAPKQRLLLPGIEAMDRESGNNDVERAVRKWILELGYDEARLRHRTDRAGTPAVASAKAA